MGDNLVVTFANDKRHKMHARDVSCSQRELSFSGSSNLPRRQFARAATSSVFVTRHLTRHRRELKGESTRIPALKCSQWPGGRGCSELTVPTGWVPCLLRCSSARTATGIICAARFSLGTSMYDFLLKLAGRMRPPNCLTASTKSPVKLAGSRVRRKFASTDWPANLPSSTTTPLAKSSSKTRRHLAMLSFVAPARHTLRRSTPDRCESCRGSLCTARPSMHPRSSRTIRTGFVTVGLKGYPWSQSSSRPNRSWSSGRIGEGRAPSCPMSRCGNRGGLSARQTST